MTKFYKNILVAPFTGAWIETPVRRNDCSVLFVAPFTGAWIETQDGAFIDLAQPWQSHPSRVRGLKLL